MKKTLFILFLFTTTFFSASCSPGYEENVAIQILDGQLRPIQNATVQITYQIDITTSKGYATTAPKFTDANGLVSFIFQNQEILADRVDCEYSIIAGYDNQKVEQKVTVNEHPSVISIQIQAYKFNAKVVDQHNNALSGAEVFIRDMKSITDKNGKTSILVGSGGVNITIKYADGFISKWVEITNDTDYTYEVGIYDFNLYAMDDEGNALEVSTQVGVKSNRTNANGTLNLKNILSATPIIKTVYKGVEKTLPVDLTTQSDYYVIYDMHAPKISNIELREKDKQIFLMIQVTDAQPRASGIAPDGITVKYSFDKAEYRAPVYVTTKDKYEAYLENIKHDGLSEIKIDARDNDGNVRNIKGYFSIMYVNETMQEKNETPVNNQTANGATKTGFSIDIIQIFAVGIGIVVLLFTINYVREKFSSP